MPDPKSAARRLLDLVDLNSFPFDVEQDVTTVCNAVLTEPEQSQASMADHKNPCASCQHEADSHECDTCSHAPEPGDPFDDHRARDNYHPAEGAEKRYLCRECNYRWVAVHKPAMCPQCCDATPGRILEVE